MGNSEICCDNLRLLALDVSASGMQIIGNSGICWGNLRLLALDVSASGMRIIGNSDICCDNLRLLALDVSDSGRILLLNLVFVNTQQNQHFRFFLFLLLLLHVTRNTVTLIRTRTMQCMAVVKDFVSRLRGTLYMSRPGKWRIVTISALVLPHNDRALRKR